jgi:hypothetical protein
MRDFEVRFERVPLMCDNTSAISVAKNLVLHKRMRHLERRQHFLRDHVEKGDIEMRYTDTTGQLANIFPNPLDASRFTDLWGRLVFAILIAWFEVELVLYHVYCIFCFFLALSSYSPQSICFTCYTSLYLPNYAYHYSRMSSNEM